MNAQKLEISINNGIQFVEEFDAETEVMVGGDVNDYVSDDLGGVTLGFEATEAQIQMLKDTDYIK